MSMVRVGFTAVSVLFVTACNEVGTPLIFGQSDTIGIDVSGSVPDQGGGITVGYKGRNIAIVPTAVISNGVGENMPIRSTTSDGFVDSLSVLGQFEANATANSPEVSLGKFFATGMAAQKLADGFAAELGLAP